MRLSSPHARIRMHVRMHTHMHSHICLYICMQICVRVISYSFALYLNVCTLVRMCFFMSIQRLRESVSRRFMICIFGVVRTVGVVRLLLRAHTVVARTHRRGSIILRACHPESLRMRVTICNYHHESWCADGQCLPGARGARACVVSC